MTPDTRIGTVLAGCRISSEIGRGGMGVVYLAEHLHLGRKVALKLLPPEYAQNERFRERFVRESRLAATIDHPNVIPVYDAGEADGLLYISMRYVEGEDLKSLIAREAPLLPERAVGILERIAAALDAAHGAGLVHRDVKPGNVLIGRNGHVYLTDFGLTRRTDSQTALTGTGLVVGTVAYMAPEQFRAGKIDARTDIYSLGCLLYQCLTGHIPFERDTEAATMFAHLNDPPPRPSEHGPGVPSALDEVVERAMAKNRDDRFPTCGDFARAARSALITGHAPDLEDTKPEARAETSELEAPAVAPRRRRRLRIIGAVAGAFVLALVAAGLFLDGEERRDGSAAAGVAPGRLLFSSQRDGNWEVYAADADGDNPRNLTNHPADDFPAVASPDGERIAFRTNRDGNFEIYVMNADGSDPVRLTNDPAEDIWPTWSPDGTTIAFTSDRSGSDDLYLVNADGTNLRRLTSDSADDLHASFSPDGELIAYESNRDGDFDIFVLALDGSGAVQVTRDPAGDRNAVWSPRGSMIAFTSDRSGNSEIYAMRPDGSQLVRLTDNAADDRFPAFTSDENHIVFQTDRSGNDDIWIMESGGDNPRPLISHRAPDHTPAWLRLP